MTRGFHKYFLEKEIKLILIYISDALFMYLMVLKERMKLNNCWIYFNL